MEAHTFEPAELFGVVFHEPLRALLIGRQALIVLGARVFEYLEALRAKSGRDK
jgi:hypothetical protein